MGPPDLWIVSPNPQLKGPNQVVYAVHQMPQRRHARSWQQRHCAHLLKYCALNAVEPPLVFTHLCFQQLGLCYSINQEPLNWGYNPIRTLSSLPIEMYFPHYLYTPCLPTGKVPRHPKSAVLYIPSRIAVWKCVALCVAVYGCVWLHGVNARNPGALVAGQVDRWTRARGSGIR